MRVRPECTLIDCNRPHKARGYCEFHYNRFRSTGDPNHTKIKRGGQKHGISRTPTWYSWAGMIERATSDKYKQYKDYKGRGIGVCSRWSCNRGFLNFFEDMGLKPKGMTLDRINNDGNYEPGNCKWSTYSEQARNKRRKYERS